ncbi:hypothetical protein RchiOBHm_Chr6g0282731 [Rosa chinensis]|uniref:Uncharacterized protein n=1 Tax=Rosa chinensis TaxID=74649 RepID=A0A2P6PTU6_ROSCH|nr:hypothetical protein RchiOBHm_Chr6g0282731 [Rosa chinensis]
MGTGHSSMANSKSSSNMRKMMLQVIEQATDAEKATAVCEFLDFKCRNKVIFHQICLSVFFSLNGGDVYLSFII